MIYPERPSFRYFDRSTDSQNSKYLTKFEKGLFKYSFQIVFSKITSQHAGNLTSMGFVISFPAQISQLRVCRVKIHSIKICWSCFQVSLISRVEIKKTNWLCKLLVFSSSFELEVTVLNSATSSQKELRNGIRAPLHIWCSDFYLICCYYCLYVSD